MPKVHHVKSARVENPVAKVGESYFWWQNYRSPKRFSKERPRPSQTVGSAFLSTVYAIGEAIEDFDVQNLDEIDAEDFNSEIGTWCDDIRQAGEECAESRDNMPESLQDSESGELLQERSDQCEEWADALESIDTEREDGETAMDWRDRVCEEIKCLTYEGS